MHLGPTTCAAGLLLGGLVLVATAGPAAAVCDAYSGACPEPPAVLSRDVPAEPPTSTAPSTAPSTLPFTGGELVLMSAVGISAVAGGVVLVVAGRRRSAAV